MLTQARQWLIERKWRALVWPLFFLVLCTSVWGATLSPSYVQCRSKNEDYARTEKYKEFWPRLWVFVDCEGNFLDANSPLLSALATLAIATFTLTLWRATVDLRAAAELQRNDNWKAVRIGIAGTKASLRVATKSADAAKEAANAAIAAERARFHVIIDDHNLDGFIRAAELYDNSPKMGVNREIRITYRFKNYGKGPGLIKEISHGIRLSRLPPDDIAYLVVRQAPVEYMVPALGETELVECESAQPLGTLQDAIAIKNGQNHVWFYGRFDYVDFVTNAPQVHRFLMRYIRTETGHWRFQSYDHKHYNQST